MHDHNVGDYNEMANIDIVKRICHELGWFSETMFEDGVKIIIRWYLDNRPWWEKIISDEYQHCYEKMNGSR